MARTVWKYELDVTDEQKIELPVGAKLLHVGVQRGKPCLWAEVNPDAATAEHTIITVGTGHRLPDTNVEHVGTYLLLDGDFVGHVYQEVVF